MITNIGFLERGTTYKDTVAKLGVGEAGGAEGNPISYGLLGYPVLMAADILIVRADKVPVGDDQRQHVELARDLALRFNHRFGETFVVPRATFPAVGARLMDLQHPTRKMSKSDDSPQGTVLVLDPPEVVAKKVKAAVTDSGAEVRYDPEEKPGVSNLLDLYAAATGCTIAAAEQELGGSRYGALKERVADAVVEFLRPVRERYAQLCAEPGEVDRRLAAGAETAASLAAGVLHRARRAAGLLTLA
jgi:tryptophanyl-tRNA synthetase